MFPGPEELVFLVLCSHPPLNSPVHERHSDETLFSCPGVFKPCGCRNKVYDLKKAVTCFLRYLANCSDLCGDGKESGFHQEYPVAFPPELLPGTLSSYDLLGTLLSD